MKIRLEPIRTATAAVALLTGLAVAAGTAEAQDKVLRAVVHADLKNLDPIATGGYITRNHGYMVFDTLFGLDENFEIQPQMVDSWEVSEDGLTYTFTLRDGLTWHDGEPVTAEDCIASIRRWMVRDGMGQKLVQFVDDMHAVDDSTFEMVLTEPYGLVLESLGKVGTHPAFMMPKRLAETDPFDQITEMVGSGPFRFVAEEWQPGNRVVYAKFEEYVPREEPASSVAGGKVVNFDRVEWLYIPDYNTAVGALSSGEIDYIEEVPHDLVPILANDPSVVVAELETGGRQGWLRLNHLHPPFDNQMIRQAVLWAIDQDTYLQAMVGNAEYYSNCGAMFVCGTPLETDVGSEPVMTRDLDKARALLEEAGYAGETVAIMQPVDIPVTSAMSIVTARALEEIGMNVELQAIDWGTLLARRVVTRPVGEGGWSILHTSWSGADLLNPISHLGVHASCDQAWPGWPCDETIEELRDAFARAEDPEEQKRLASELQERAYDFVTYAPLGQFERLSAYRAELTGLIESPAPLFWGIDRQ